MKIRKGFFFLTEEESMCEQGSQKSADELSSSVREEPAQVTAARQAQGQSYGGVHMAAWNTRHCRDGRQQWTGQWSTGTALHQTSGRFDLHVIHAPSPICSCASSLLQYMKCMTNICYTDVARLNGEHLKDMPPVCEVLKKWSASLPLIPWRVHASHSHRWAGVMT